MSQSNFAACLAEVLRHEGGYVDHPADPGGATNRGITLRTLAEWRGVSPWQDLPKTEVRNLGLDETSDIYRARHWNAVDADALPKGVDLALFDFAVHSGPPRAARFLQAIVGTSQDGVVGPVTIAAVERVVADGHGSALIRKLCQNRQSFLESLNTFSVFGAGWTRRVAETRSRALAMMAAAPTPSQSKGPSRMEILSGYKTYIVGALMLVTAIAQLAGVDIPGFEGQSAMQLLMEGLAIVFLRKGLKSDTAA